jgi:N-acetylmuramoyl-L-alanine amidase
MGQPKRTRGLHKVAALTLLCALGAVPATARSVAAKKQIARGSFEQAERMREALNGRPIGDRSAIQYQRVIDAYRKVYYTAPTYSHADASVLAVAELLAEQGRNFDDQKLLQAAIGQYEFLRREYPGSKHRFGALFAIAEIYRDDLNDSARAKATFQEFLKRYPSNASAADATSALARMDADEKARKSQPKSARNRPEPAQPKSEQKIARSALSKNQPADQSADEDRDAVVRPPDAKLQPAGAKPSDAAAQHAPHSGKLPLVTGIRHWSTPDYTRIAIDLEDEIGYDAGRVPNPDRIFFDLHNAKLAPGLTGKEFVVEDGLLHKIRVAQYLVGQARIVFDVGDVADYSAFLLPNPYRLIVDIHGKPSARASQTAKSSAPLVLVPPVPKPTAIESRSNYADDAPRNVVAVKTTPAVLPTSTNSTSKDSVVKTIDDGTPAVIPDAEKSRPASVKNSAAKRDSTIAKSDARKGVRGAGTREARPTSEGDRSLIRALGLKIGRIVVDAGHGGHDTGTIGPTGLLEKDLVLDVALRLGKLLESRMGADVVYTRDDDTFIPLETRTAIANREQADLFVSVHANSSSDPAARGVETYYLNFTSSADALEVAARENAVSDQSIHELQDLVKKIALKEKIDESREFAGEVERSLHAGLSVRNASMRDRGVKKAPFIVLIGANMPSILAEISFLSNPADERRLKTPEYRQKIAESLYRGIARYVSGLSGVKVAAAPKQTVP